jgi:MoxR-like ATPase
MKDMSAELAELKSLVSRAREPAGRRSHAHPRRAEAAGGSSAAAAAELAPEKLDELLSSLRDVLEQPVEDLEEAIASHPLGSAAAAFFLGVLVGRLLPRG